MFGKKKEDDQVEMPKEELKVMCKEFRVSKPFVIVLSIVSILGFIGIISKTLFFTNIDHYIESSWFLIMGIGFIIEATPLRLFKKIERELDQSTFSSMTTLIVGLLATVAGILTLLQIQNPAFQAMQGLISIIAIVFIAVQTWILK